MTASQFTTVDGTMMERIASHQTLLNDLNDLVYTFSKPLWARCREAAMRQFTIPSIYPSPNGAFPQNSLIYPPIHSVIHEPDFFTDKY